MVSGKISLDYAMEIANDVLPKEEVKGYISLLQEAHYKTNV